MMELSGENEKNNGCKMQLHVPSEVYGTTIEKLRKTMNRVISHQLIILENQPPYMIEDIIVKELTGSSAISGHD